MASPATWSSIKKKAEWAGIPGAVETTRSSASNQEMVLKGGMIAYAQMGDANASIPTPQPVYPRPMFGGFR